MRAIIGKHGPNALLLAVWWQCSPVLGAGNSMFKHSVLDIVLLAFVRSELHHATRHSASAVVVARALASSLFAVKLSLFDTSLWTPRWIPITMQVVNLVWCWAETLWPCLVDLWAVAQAPPEQADQPRAPRNALVAAAAPVERTADARTASRAAPCRPVPTLHALCVGRIAQALAVGTVVPTAEALGDHGEVPLPDSFLERILATARERWLLNDAVLEAALGEHTKLALSPSSAAYFTAAAADVAAPSARQGRAVPPPPASPLVTDIGLTVVAERCRDLTALSLPDQRAVTDGGIATIAAHCPQLRLLELRRCPGVTAATITVVATTLPHMEVLLLGGCSLDADGIDHLGGGNTCVRLHTLDVSSSQLAFPDAGAWRPPSLTELNITRCPRIMTGDQLALVESCASLRRIFLSAPRVASSGAFEDALRGRAAGGALDVVFDVPVREFPCFNAVLATSNMMA